MTTAKVLTIATTPEPTPIAINPKLQKRAIAVQERLLEIYDTAQRSFVEMGSLIIEAEDSKLWAQLVDENGEPFKTLDHWISTALPYGRTTCYAARTFLRGMAGVSPETLKEIPRTNIKPLLMLPAPKRKSQRWLKAAATMPHAAFSKQIHLIVPEEEQPKGKGTRVVFVFPAPSMRVYEKAMRRAADELATGDETPSREECFEYVCKSYLEITQPARKRAG